MNYNHKNYKNIEFVTQEEIDKMSYNEKFFPPCKCGKNGEFRWKKSDLDCDGGMFYAITPLKGKNGEEVCHKCAPCVKCGKEARGDRFNKYEKTNDNPSGKWGLAHCSIECFNGTEKPSLPKKEPEKTASCDYCGKLSEFNKVGNTFWGKSFCSSDCYELAFARISSLKNRDDIRAHCCVCNSRIFGEDGNFTEDFKNRKGNVYYSDRSINAFFCSEECFEKKGDKSGMSGCAFFDKNPTSSDNSPKPIPAAPNSQPITNKSDKNNVKTIKFEDTLLKPTEIHRLKLTIKPLIINLKSIKQITLTSDNNLVIEFNKTEANSASREVKIVNDMQINSSRELQKVKSYLQGSGEKSVNQQRLDSILSSDSANTGITGNPNNYTLAVGLSLMVLSGLTIGLLVKRKLKAVRK